MVKQISRSPSGLRIAALATLLGLCLAIPLIAQTTPDAEPPPPAVQEEGAELNLFALMWQSKWFMLPIGLMSMLVVAVTFERGIGLRKSRILPNGLVRQLALLDDGSGHFDPREAYRLCQRYRSAASNVIRAMLLKVGRPHSEIEHAIAEASDREAERLYSNVRWLNLAAAVSPLLGLLGTVWGMIRAFHDTTQMAPGMNKADYLAEGIYTALVTTLAGLLVAIPAAILSHYFEGRIQSLFHRIDDLLFQLAPHIEPFEGRVRFTRGIAASSDELASNAMEGNGPEPPRAARARTAETR